MPNWCQNEVVINGSPEAVKALLEKASEGTTDGAKNTFSMGNLVPMPEELNEGTGWYQWNIDNWGTKWDLDQSETKIEYFESSGIAWVTMYYQTAWSPNEAFWQKVSSLYPSLYIDLRYAEEGMNFIGQMMLKSGLIMESTCRDLEVSDYVLAGAVPSKDYKSIDWDNTKEYNLFDVFPI